MLVTRGLARVGFSPGPWGSPPSASPVWEWGEERTAGEGWRPCPGRGLENEENWGSTAVLKAARLPEACLDLHSWGQRAVLHSLPTHTSPSPKTQLFQSSMGSNPSSAPFGMWPCLGFST